MNTIRTNDNMVAALTAAKIPAAVAERIAMVYPVADIRKIVSEEDKAKLQEIVGVGSKRADTVIHTLQGRIPKMMSQPCPDVKSPDVEMHNVPELTLMMQDDKPALKLTANNHKRYGPALQKLQQLTGKENVAFTTVSVIDVKEAKDQYQLQKYWDHAVHDGIVAKNKLKYMPAIMGTNSKMSCKIHWAEESAVEEFHKWTDCGADMSKPQNLAKAAAYRGLLLPFTRELAGGVITPEMECIVPSFNNTKESEAVLFNPDGGMEPVEKTVTNEFDGQAYFEMTDKLKAKLKRHERRRLERAIATFKGGTLRAPWQKGLIVTGFHFHDYLRDLGVTHIDGKSIDDIALLADETVFKAKVGENGLYKEFGEYCAAFRKDQHRFGVLLENHGPKQSYLPAQQLQAAYGSDEETIRMGAAEEIAHLNAAANPRIAARRYAPKSVGQIAEDDPSFANVWFAKGFINQGYAKERTTSLAGRTHGNSVVGFVVKDPIAHMQWIAYLEGKRADFPEGFLKANEIYAPEAGFNGTAVASRNPVIAPYGLPLVEVTDNAGEYSKYFEDGFPFITTSIRDNLSKLLRYDQDGDKVRLTYAPWFVATVRSIREKYGVDYGRFAEWESFGAVEKKSATEENMLDFFASCTTTPTLGLNVDMSGKLMANKLLESYDSFMLLDYAMNRGTDVKQGADGTVIPGEAGKLFDQLTAKSQDALYTISQRTGKTIKGRTVEAEKVHQKYGHSNTDIIANAVSEKTNETLDFDGSFNVELVISKQFRKIEGLIRYGTPEKEYTDEGLFNNLVRRSAAEWAAIDPDQKCRGNLEDYKRWRKQQAIAELRSFAEERGLTLEDVYDALTTHVFLNMAKTYNGVETTEKKRRLLLLFACQYLNWFGDMMVDTYCRNKEIDGLRVSQPIECDELDF